MDWGEGGREGGSGWVGLGWMWEKAKDERLLL